jgi:hypothetical protein
VLPPSKIETCREQLANDASAKLNWEPAFTARSKFLIEPETRRMRRGVVAATNESQNIVAISASET